jgi:LPXTG-motif cell wall-anchored protein
VSLTRYLEIAVGGYLAIVGGVWALYSVTLAVLAPYLSGNTWEWVGPLGSAAIGLGVILIGVGFLIGKRRRRDILASWPRPGLQR